MIKTKYLIEKNEKSIIMLMQLLTFDIVIIKGKDRDAWIENKFQNLSKECFRQLKEKKFIIEEKREDKEILELSKKYFGVKKLRAPNIVIYLTNECNLRCSYCYSGYENEKKNEKISKEDIDQIFQAIDKIYEKNEYLPQKPIISLFGGEPLLPSNKKAIEYIIEKMNQQEYQYLEIVTNLVNVKMFKDIVNKFKEKISFRVTLNGDENLHDSMRKFPNGGGTYKIIFLNIQFVLKYMPKAVVDLSILIDKSITKQNIDNLFIDLKKSGILDTPRAQVKFGHIQFRSNYVCQGFENRVMDVSDYYPTLLNYKKNNLLMDDSMIQGSSMYILKEIYSSLICEERVVVPNYRGCDAVYPGRFCFFTDGQVYPCFDCVGMDGFAIGAYRGGMKFYKKYDEWKNFSVSDIEKCNSCKYVGICNGGCLISNISKNGSMSDVYCENVEEAIGKFLHFCYQENMFYEI